MTRLRTNRGCSPFTPSLPRIPRVEDAKAAYAHERKTQYLQVLRQSWVEQPECCPLESVLTELYGVQSLLQGGARRCRDCQAITERKPHRG